MSDTRGFIKIPNKCDSRSLRVVLLRGTDWHHHTLEQRISEAFDLRIIVEEGYWPRVLRTCRLGYRTSAFWQVWHWLRRKITFQDYRRRRYFPPVEKAVSHKTLCVASVNDDRVRQILSQVAPDIVVVI
jgi:hypothetical protein